MIFNINAHVRAIVKVNGIRMIMCPTVEEIQVLLQITVSYATTYKR